MTNKPKSEVQEWRDELRKITDSSGIQFLDKYGQNEVVSIESFIEQALTKAKQQGSDKRDEEVLEEIEELRTTNENSMDFKMGDHWSTHGYPKALKGLKQFISKQDLSE